LSIYSRFDQFALMHVNFDHWRLAVESALDSHKVKPRSRVDPFTTNTACELVCRGLGRTHFQSERLSSSGRLQLPLAHHFTSELAKYLWGEEMMLDVEVALCAGKS
jgi:hypothetical protein